MFFASYPNELHLVHFKTAYVDLGEAIKHADGLAVLGVFLEVSGADNAKLTPLINGLQNITNTGGISFFVFFLTKSNNSYRHLSLVGLISKELLALFYLLAQPDLTVSISWKLLISGKNKVQILSEHTKNY